jgi:hypothetical protein
MGRQPCTSRANSPDIAGKPLGQRIHELLVLDSRSRRWRGNSRDLFPRRLLGNDLVRLAVLRLLIAMVCIIRLPTKIGVCRINSGFGVTAGDGTIDEVSKRGGGNGPDGAGA